MFWLTLGITSIPLLQSSRPQSYECPPWFFADQIFFGIERIKYIFSCVLAPENADCLDIIVINVVICISNWSLLQHHLFQHQSWKFKRTKEKEHLMGQLTIFLYWKHQIISIEYFYVFWNHINPISSILSILSVESWAIAHFSECFALS